MATRYYRMFGTSTVDGILKLRCSASALYGKMLEARNEQEIKLVDFKVQMNKVQGFTQLLDYPEFQDVDSQSTIREYLNTMAIRSKPKTKTKEVPVSEILTEAMKVAMQDREEIQDREEMVEG